MTHETNIRVNYALLKKNRVTKQLRKAESLIIYRIDRADDQRTERKAKRKIKTSFSKPLSKNYV